MFNAGVLYRDGLGVPVDFSAAMDWFLKAATGENSLAMNSIGVMYQKGQGVPVDYREAMRWYRKAVEFGNETAPYNIGVLYERGLGVPVDREEAHRWYSKAVASAQSDVSGRRTVDLGRPPAREDAGAPVVFKRVPLWRTYRRPSSAFFRSRPRRIQTSR